MLLIKRSLKSERRYWLVVRLKAIKYKEDFLCYLSSTSSLQGPPSPQTQSLHESFIFYFVTSSSSGYSGVRTIEPTDVTAILIGSYTRIPSADALFAWTIQQLRTEPSSTRLHHQRYLHQQLLCRHSYSSSSMMEVKVDVDVLESETYATSSQPCCSPLTVASTSGFFFVTIEGTPLQLLPLDLERGC